MPNPNVVSYNTLLSGYFNSGLITEAMEAFSAAPSKDCHSWNIAISGLIKNQRIEEAITLFLKMRFVFGDWCYQMYVSAGVFDDARKVFDEMLMKGLVAWNALLSGYSRCGLGDVCLSLYKQLCREGDCPDEYTYSTVLNELASHLQVVEATQIHSTVIKVGFLSDPFITNNLLELYAKCGLVDSALALFKEIAEKDVFSWTTIVTGLSQSGHLDDALWLFQEMLLANVQPSSFTFGGLLGACATTNMLKRGKQLHGLVIKHGFADELVTGTAILDMYFKCGEVQDAYLTFRSIPVRDIVLWNGIISGYAQNGEVTKALELFEQMVQLGPSAIAPNDATFASVRSACSHGGLVKEGCKFFNDMIHKHMITPKLEHYTCMVDMLGRAGLLDEAEALLLQMPFEPDAVMWSSLLGACKLHRHLTMAARICEHLHTSGPWNPSNYVLLTNSYAFIGGWKETLETREVMDLRRIKKSVGCSWVEIGRCMHSFLSGDKLHPQIKRVCEVLKSIYIQGFGKHDKVLNFVSN